MQQFDFEIYQMDINILIWLYGIEIIKQSNKLHR